MKRIALDNYEIFAIDYLEGRLKGADLKAFELFLTRHPGIKKEMELMVEGFENFENSTGFEDKTSLKQGALLSENINTANFPTYFVAFHEGDLAPETKRQVLRFIEEHPNTSEAFEAFTKLKFIPDHAVQFPLKRKLKKSTPILLLYRAMRVAASVIILLGLAWYFMQSHDKLPRYTQRTHPVRMEQNNVPESDSFVPAGMIKSDVASKYYSGYKNNPQEMQKSSDSPLMSERNNNLPLASVAVTQITFYQSVKPTVLPEDIAHSAINKKANNSVFKIKLPKLFKKNKRAHPESDSDVLAKFNRKNKTSDRVNYLDIGPLKVYKKKSVSANADKIDEETGY